VNADGRAFVSHTDLGGRHAIRVAIGNMATTAEHVDAAWELMRAASAGA
jgi:aromatic-L-amino-acid decarboxylase